MFENKSMPDGVKYYGEKSNRNKYSHIDLLTAFKYNDGIVIELVDFQDGKLIKQWFPKIDKITALTKKSNKHLNPDWFMNSLVHPLILKDSSILFSTWESVVKINSNSNVEWVRGDYKAHHAMEKDHENNVWLSGRRNRTKIKGLLKDDISDEDKMRFIDDLILKINPLDGEVLFEKSVIELLTENNLGHLIYTSGYYDLDPIHLNDVQPALKDGEYWKKGDLLLSFRHLSTIPNSNMRMRSNLTFPYKVSRADKNLKNNHKSIAIWFFGLSGAGKSTICDLVEQRLSEKNVKTAVLDGDAIRNGLNKDLLFSAQD